MVIRPGFNPDHGGKTLDTVARHLVARVYSSRCRVDCGGVVRKQDS